MQHWGDINARGQEALGHIHPVDALSGGLYEKILVIRLSLMGHKLIVIVEYLP